MKPNIAQLKQALVGVSLLLITAFCAPSTIHASDTSLKLSETYSEWLRADWDFDDWEYDYEVERTVSASFSATLPLGDVDIDEFDRGTWLEIVVGGVTVFSEQLRDAADYYSGRRSATFLDWDGVLKASWNSSRLTISAWSKEDVFELADRFDGTEGRIDRYPLDVTVTLGDFSFSRPVFLHGTSKHKTVERDDEDYDLRSFDLGASADTTAPVVSITSPAAGYRTTSPEDVTFAGQVSDNVAVAAVYYCVSSSPKLKGNEPFLEAELSDGLNRWTAQVTPQLGTNYVFVKAYDTSGNASTVVRRDFRYVQGSPIQVVIEGNGRINGVSDGQTLELGAAYTVAAQPGSGQVLAYWWDSAQDAAMGAASSYRFVMSEGLVLTAVFVPNPYPAAKGTYAGLFYSPDGTLDPTNSGSFSFTVSANGAYSGKLTMLSGTYPFSGQLALNPEAPDQAVAPVKVLRGKLPPLTGELQLALPGSGAVSGWYRVADSTDETVAQGNFDGLLTRASVTSLEQGAYNFYLADSETSGGPAGFSFGTATLDAKGGVKWMLTVADPDQSATLSLSTALTTEGTVPLCFPLYGGKGLLLGWALIQDGALSGTDIGWLKLPGKTYYPDGFAHSVTATGLRYVAPKSSAEVVDWSSGHIALFDNAGIDSLAELSFAKGKFTVVGSNPDKISVAVKSSSGTLSGSFTPAGTRQSRTIKGVLLKGVDAPGVACGFFKSPEGSGAVVLESE